MSTHAHPEWPDKAMFASLLLVAGGVLGLLHALALAMDATVGADVPLFLRAMNGWIVAAASVAAITLGIVALRRHQPIVALFGAIAAIASMGFWGLTPVFGIAAVAFVGLSRREGEQPTNVNLWPDKAMGASLFLAVGGALLLFEALALALGHFEPPFATGQSGHPVAAIVTGLLGAGLIASSFEVYHARRAWAGYAASGLAILSLGFYILVPACGVAALTYLLLARREHEFSPAVAA